jgi:catechol 2,3-dioxygenase
VTVSDGRLPAATSIGGVRLRVADLDRSLAFYEGMLGLVPDREGDTAALTSAAGGDPFIRLEAVHGTTARPEGVIGLYHFAILYPDRASLAGAIRSLIDARWRFSGFADHGVSEAAYLQDPDGIGMELYVDRPRAVWPVDPAGRIAMYTRMPDLDDLLAERGGGGGAERIGHIHLHVRDLDASTRFHRDVVGFDVTQDGLPGAVFLSAGGYHHHVGLNTWARGRTTGPDSATMLSWTLRVPDEQAAAALEERLDLESDSAGAGAGWLDPDGNVMVVETLSSDT